MSTAEVPLLSTRGLVLQGETPLVVGSLEVSGARLALFEGASALLSAFSHPAQIVEGSLLLCGEVPAALLQDGRAAYVPASLPLPPSTRVKDAMALSARLVGLSKDDAEDSLSRCRMSTHGKKKLGDLTRLQTRLLSLAHGLCGSPSILLLEDLYIDLDDVESDIVEGILDVELDDRMYVVATSADHPSSRTLTHRAGQVLTLAGRQMVPPVTPETLQIGGFWVTCTGDAGALLLLLEARGAKVVKSPREQVLLVRDIRGEHIYQAARQAGVSVVELCPARSSEDFS